MRLKLFMALAAILTASLLVLGAERFLDAHFAQVAILVFLILLAMAAGVVSRPEPSLPLLCDPYALGCVFLAQFYVIGALASEFGAAPTYLFLRPLSPERSVQVLFAFLLMLVMFFIGYRVRFGETLAEMLPDFSAGRKKPSWVWIDTAILGLGIGGSLGWIWYQGGLLAKLSSGYGEKPGGAMFLISHDALLVGTLLLAWRVAASDRGGNALRFLFGALLLFYFAFFGIVYGVRKYLFYLFFGMMTIWLLRRGVRAISKTRLAIVAVLLLAFFSFWGAVRSVPVMSMIGGARDPRLVGSGGANSAYLGSVAEPFTVACVVFDVFPSEEPFQHGKTLLVTLLGFIPRAVWPDKPVGMGKLITRYFVGPYYEPVYGLSMAPTVVGDFYLNFGWFGLILGGLLLGIVCRTVASYAVRGMRDGLQLQSARVLIPAVFLMGLGELRAQMAAMLAFYALTYLPLLIALSLFRHDDPGTGAPAE